MGIAVHMVDYNYKMVGMVAHNLEFEIGHKHVAGIGGIDGDRDPKISSLKQGFPKEFGFVLGCACFCKHEALCSDSEKHRETDRTKSQPSS